MELLHGRSFELTGDGEATTYAAHLLASLGARVRRAPGPADPDPDLDWARSGAMWLTGPRNGPPRLAPAALASCARGALRAIRVLTGPASLRGLDGPALLGERAVALGLRRAGSVAPGGSCRLLRAVDGWLALNLARPDDVELLPAWLCADRVGEPWNFAANAVAKRPASELVARARMIGLPAAVATAAPSSPPSWLEVTACGPARSRGSLRPPRVLDLSSLWAGPLCASLLRLAGAHVVKLESRSRPDGMRRGSRELFALLNGGKASAALDLQCERHLEWLRGLIARADIVIESSRPRALAQLGLHAEALVERQVGLTWISITGYGRRDPASGWVALGDDAAVAAGLALETGRELGFPLFCGDAIADPLTGLHATLAALASWQSGGGRLVSLALRDVTAHALVTTRHQGRAAVVRRRGSWEVHTSAGRAPVSRPRARSATISPRAVGQDTAAVLRDWIGSC